MAIAFNIPSERDSSEENFSRLNRLLAELYEVLCRILVARQPGQESQENRRDRPYSEADAERPSAVLQTCRLQSASSPPVAFGLEAELEDDVFISPRTDNGNDPFSTRNLDIFGYRSPRTPAGVLLNPRRDKTFSFSLTSEKQWRDKGGTALAVQPADTDTDVTDAAPSEDGSAEAEEQPRSSSSSIFSSFIPDKVSGSICTALLLMIGWKILSNKRFSNTQPT